MDRPFSRLLRRLAPAEFQDPAGLAGRMLRSGNPAARWALVLATLQILALPLDALLAPFERRWLRQAHADDLPAILIVGPPRSGTTLIYQVLARCLDVSYLDNFSSLFPRATITSARLFHRLRQHLPPSTDNYYGQTAGLAGVNDGFHVWNRFLGGDRYHPATSIADAERAALRTFLTAWHAAYEKPFLSKNNRNTSCMTQLAETLDSAHFIVVRRDPRLIVQSLLRSREVIQGDRSVGWGLSSESTRKGDGPLADVDEVCRQLGRILVDYDRQRQAIDPARLLEVDYEAFCRDPADFVQRVAAWLPVALRQPAALAKLPRFTAAQRDELTDAERERVEGYFPTAPSQVPPMTS